MGSFDGVIRYDSKEIVRFTHKPGEVNGLPSNIITSLAIDKQNNIWVSSEEGLCLFNHSLQQFERVVYNYENGEPANNTLFSIELDRDGKLWIADEDFFGYLDEGKKQLIRITEGLDKPPRLLYRDKANQMWLGTLDGSVYLVIPDENKVVKKVEGPGSEARTIYANDSEIWVGYETHGARLYDMEGNLRVHFSYPSNPKFDIKSASIRKIWRDTRGQTWIGSYHGLFLSVGTKLIHFNHTDYEGIPNNSIYDIFEDEQGGIWIGTWSGGVSYMHHADNKFNNYRYSREPASLSNNMVSSFAQMPDGEIFVGTEQGGLNSFDLKTKHFKDISALENEGVINIKELCVDKNGGLWVACAFKGVYYRPKNQENFIHFELGEEDGKHISALGAYGLCDSDSGMWIGTNFGGVNFYDYQTKRISFKSKEYPFSQLYDLNIRSLLLDSYDNLWALTTHGIYKFHLPTGNSAHFSTNGENNRKTRSQSFYFVAELSDGKIWMGTGGDGINIYHPDTDELSFFDINGLLKGKDVYGIIESQDNQIWITSNDGLILYNTRDTSSRRFVITDGIQGNLFNPNAIFKDRDSNLYFGGTNGFTQLEPREININQRPPNVFINNIKVNNREIVPTQTGINEFAKLVLNPEETTLSFNFSADNFLLPEKNRFEYRLTNYVDQWVQDGNHGSANFVNIPAGEYVFEVRASNNDGVWQDTPARLPIVIKQFWYKSNIALALYLLAILIIIMQIVRFYRERLKLKKALLIEKIKHEHEEQLNEMKLRFFTNISHEFRTPLTLIDWPIKNLLKSKNFSFEERDQLEIVKRNTNRLLQLISQILDLRKVEEGQVKLNISKIELVDFIKEIIFNFSEEAKSKNISFSFTHEMEQCKIETDKDKLDKIIYNLLSNAFKYTPANGKIEVSLQESDRAQSNNYFSNQLSFGKLENEDFVEIMVTDSGMGIDSDDLPNIFNRFEQGKREKIREDSTGIGLSLCKDYTLLHRGVIIVQSTPGEGTRFSVRIPLKQKAQKILYESHQTVKNINSWGSQEKEDFPSKVANKNIKILVVEDHEDLRKYLIGFLKGYYSVLFAENGIQGLEILETQNVQLIIADVMMPSMDGFEFCQKVKSQIETSHIPVILLSALSSAENTTTGLEKGADAYISKPFDESVLLAQINNLLLQRKRLQESYTQKFMTNQHIDIGNLDNYFLNKLNAIIEKNIENEYFTVDFLAKEMGFSRSQLHRKLKQISNHSASEYITTVKIRKATTLLSSMKYNIDEVAHKAGFNSHSYFTKCFKKIHQQTPKEFLKNI
ncbi:MAG: hybrid sensor histidine kinase/response regulator [Saprospiraceae bacterium]|nr:MAG: hybrid sensor histidine kinase/response regulator [Saprospiraceae bacterium]